MRRTADYTWRPQLPSLAGRRGKPAVIEVLIGQKTLAPVVYKG